MPECPKSIFLLFINVVAMPLCGSAVLFCFKKIAVLASKYAHDLSVNDLLRVEGHLLLAAVAKRGLAR